MKPAISNELTFFLQGWRWDWFVTPTFRNPVSLAYGIKEVIRWLNQLKSSTTRARFGAYFTFPDISENTHAHILIVFSKIGAMPIVFPSPSNAKKIWKHGNIDICFLETKDDSDRVAGYLTRAWNQSNQVGVDGLSSDHFYRPGLLSKLRGSHD